MAFTKLLWQLVCNWAAGSNDYLFSSVFGLCCQVITGETLNVHLILDDPTGNSYMQVFIAAVLVITCEQAAGRYCFWQHLCVCLCAQNLEKY